MLPQSRNRILNLHNRKVLLIDKCQATRKVRAAVLRSHGVEVLEAENLSGAGLVWQPNVYDLVMLDVRRYSPGEVHEFHEHVKGESPRERVAFLVGPPVYLSRTWPEEAMGAEKQPRQWAEAVKRFLAAA